jgi:hypothetical protein
VRFRRAEILKPRGSKRESSGEEGAAMVDSVIHWTTALIFSVLAVSLWPKRRARETDATVTARRIRPRTRQEFLRAA